MLGWIGRYGRIQFYYLNKKRKNFAFGLKFDEGPSPESVDGDTEVSGEESDDKGHRDLTEERLPEFRQDDVGDERQDEEDVGDGATDGICNACYTKLVGRK